MAQALIEFANDANSYKYTDVYLEDVVMVVALSLMKVLLSSFTLFHVVVHMGG